jgi:hypothetical protein
MQSGRSEEGLLAMQKSAAAAVLTLAAIASVSAGAFAKDSGAIPPEFHGIWGFEMKQCFASEWRSLDTLHRISGTKTEWWEASCGVARAVASPGDPGTLEVQLTCSGEGEEWTSKELWKRIDIEDGKFLISAIPAAGRLQFYRLCD